MKYKYSWTNHCTDCKIVAGGVLKYIKYKSNKIWNADNEALSDSAAEVLLRHPPWMPSFVKEMKCFLQLNPLLFRNPFVFLVKAQFIISLMLILEIAQVCFL